MIKVIYKAGLTKVVAEEATATINLATVFTTAGGLGYGQPQDIAFYEGRRGIMRSSYYAIGTGRAYGRVIHATPDELKQAFAQARIPVRIVTRKEQLEARAAAQPVQKLDLAA